MSTEVLTDAPETETDDSDDYAHVAPKDEVARAYIEGTPVWALCGVKFVPSRDPEKYPICPDCAAIRKGINSRGSN